MEASKDKLVEWESKVFFKEYANFVKGPAASVLPITVQD
jgi:hypothetical protein